ncbi:SPT2 chromatin protein [Rhynchospora pubera]|uniref:SPT2 chromatin protein n=1 Tax=Rhynchospora pubera TaxID=906938 RepID=A0AAV8G949_9POAL|nr:SPT2 chromatin protein [Rhynchospora pubera]
MRDPYDNDYYDDEEEGYVDEYEEEEEEQEEVRELPKPTKEEKEFLSRRERLKEKFRQKLSKEMASAFGRSALRKTLKTSSENKFGSFFGPSLPGIAPRVIEETKSLKENGYLHSSKHLSSSTTNGAAPMSSRPKSLNGQSHRPKIVNEVKKKVEILKDNRDYSFLLSDDADTPHEPSSKNISQLRSDPSTSQHLSSRNMKEPSRGHLTGPNGRSAPCPAGTPAQRHLQQQHPRQGSTGQRHPQQQLQRSGTSRQHSPPSNRPRPMPSGSQRPRPSTGSKAPTTSTAVNKAPMKAVNGTSNQHPVVKKATVNGTRNHHPMKAINGTSNHHPMKAINGTSNHQPMKAINGTSNQNPVVKKTSVSSNSRPQASLVQRHPTEKKIGSLSAKPGVKSTPPSKPQLSKQMATNANGRVGDHGNKNIVVKKKPVAKRPFDDEEDDAIGLIRRMFNYNPNRWAGREEDDSDMEVGFDVIQKEERLSSQIARKEDEEQLRLIEEEERRERMRKKQKLRHS